jgi:hypothetical protein
VLSSGKELQAMRVPNDLDRLLADPSVTTLAQGRAALRVLRSHRQSGDPVVVWRDGHVVELGEDEISRLLADLSGDDTAPHVA